MAEILIGTSGYSYSDWVGPFYPEGMKKNVFLSFYSSHFNIAELNFTYYQQPSESIINRMVDITKPDFYFSIKTHQTMTHKITSAWKRDAKEFIDGISTLISSNRLKSVLMQFPYSFHYSTENRKYLSAICNELSFLPLVVEFRNIDWQKETVYKGLKERDAGFVCTDNPDLKGLPAAVDITTSDLSYIRFHGRNRENWWTGNNTTRYDYLYSKDELMEWLPAVKNISKKSKTLIIVFNNHYKGQAVKNAKMLEEILKGELN